MADYGSMQPNQGTSCSGLREATTNVTRFEEMPGEVRATLNSYVPLDADDETVKLLWETFRYLPSDGRVNLAKDIVQAGAGNQLHRLAQNIVSGLLKPIMIAGIKKVEIPRLSSEESLKHLANTADEHELMIRAQQQLQEDALRRDGDKCVVSGHYDVLSEELYPDQITADLETAYIVPFALSKFKDEYEKQRIIAVWTNISRYFPSVRSQLNFNYQDINSMVNVMTLSLPLHTQFRRFSLALEQITGTINQYRVKTFRGFATAHRAELPASGTISMTAHDGRFPLASPILLQVHCAVANILHVTGEGAKIARLLRDYDATGGLSSKGSTNISQLLSVTKLDLVPHARRFDGRSPTDD
ncbi:hypothetical protein ALT_3881 [Aspergillus lentulus]|uniref:HNH nuclease domain-containing protein n=1 Tax=Aspergillus lentulus TaxID=293939 RepID=A0AAN4T9Q6_ASPLE|nr:uncharacterized protein IFM58399_06018 [Aspergillus lentulus]KAF4157864.1 hypothetical protein CNMCM6069_004947 [Aspergillus lentulus]KAF4163400.1 hypothetical protein CNMCM6936_000861 [Aspergillus lentulus]KAF4173300.1 hypothetical protein CNMCM8060_000274 [Aspergillus lentulus]KAF4187382.1 hypothetical protein CNMCM7927_004087 [Aspergillus lentulus]KAF4198043.1 hypothetical protein CNMCM8694_001234 [Aspergillus lentulus]